MNKILRYQTLRFTKAEDLDNGVDKAIKDGWQA